MTDTTISIFDAVSKIDASWPGNDIGWPNGVPAATWQEPNLSGIFSGGPEFNTFTTEPGRAVFDVLTYVVSCENGGQTLDYYLIELSGILRYVVPQTLACDGYSITIAPVDGRVLLDSASPDTTQGAVSTSVSVSTTISGNLGFMGDAPTGGGGASMTTSRSRTVELPGVVITNNGLQTGQTASWRYTIADGSPSAYASFNHMETVLFKVDRAAGLSALEIDVTTSFYVSDHGGGGSRWFDEYHNAVNSAGFGGIMSNTDERAGVITLPPHRVVVGQPPAPKTA